MKNLKEHIAVSSTFRMDTHFDKMELSETLDLLYTDEARMYNAIELSDDFYVTLTRSTITCPYCNYAHQIKWHRNICHRYIDKIKEWANPQISLFLFEQNSEDISGQKNVIVFFSPERKSFDCPRCKKTSYSKGNNNNITISHSKANVSIRCEVNNLMKILSLPYLPRGMISIVFPFYEQIEFNFRTGHAFVRLLNSDKVIHTLDITNNPHILSESELATWFCKTDTLKQSIIESFQAVSGVIIPFNPQDITLEDLVFLVRFIGYDKSFYSAIPYSKESLAIDKSFSKQIHKLHTLDSAVKYMSSFAMSKNKSIRKLICEKTGLLFFLPECETLYSAIGDVNVFRNILCCKYVFDILLTLHQKPLFVDFFRDYCDIKGAAGLYRIIRSPKYSWAAKKDYMLSYGSLNKYGKSAEKRKWESKSEYIYKRYDVEYSLPMTLTSPQNANAVIDGFAFKPLKNTSECFRAGKELKNCLKSWDSYDAAIITVSQSKEIVAAIAVKESKITQAYSYDNNGLDQVPGLKAAVDKWAQRNALVFDDDDDDDIDYYG